MRKRWLLAAPLALFGAAFFYWLALPWPLLLRWVEPDRTAFMERRLREAAADGDQLALRHTWVPLDDISRHLRRAVIVAEDGNFYSHRGIDWGALAEELRYEADADFSLLDPRDLDGLLRATRYYLDNREKIRGRSTLTQQLAKNLYFGQERSLTRKFDEFVVARRLEWFLSKDRILELYLNIAEWGPGVFGAEAAARTYFERAASDLTRTQAASLAATLPHPLSSNPAMRPGRMAWRRDLILARMTGEGPVRTVPLERIPERVAEPESVVVDPVRLALDSVRLDSAKLGDSLVRRDTLAGRDTLVRRDTMPRADTVRPGRDTIPGGGVSGRP